MGKSVMGIEQGGVHQAIVMFCSPQTLSLDNQVVFKWEIRVIMARVTLLRPHSIWYRQSLTTFSRCFSMCFLFLSF